MNSSNQMPDDFAKADAARRVNDYMNHYVKAIDSKAGLFLVGNVASASMLLKDWPCDGIGYYSAVASITFFAASTSLAGAAIFPRLPPLGSSVLYWGDVSRDKNGISYAKRFDLCVEEGRLDDQYSLQNYCTAVVIRQKVLWLRRGIFLFFFALMTGFLAYLRVTRVV